MMIFADASELSQYIGIAVGAVTLVAVIFGAGITYNEIKSTKTILAEHMADNEITFAEQGAQIHAIEVDIGKHGVRLDQLETRRQ